MSPVSHPNRGLFRFKTPRLFASGLTDKPGSYTAAMTAEVISYYVWGDRPAERYPSCVRFRLHLAVTGERLDGIAEPRGTDGFPWPVAGESLAVLAHFKGTMLDGNRALVLTQFELANEALRVLT